MSGDTLITIFIPTYNQPELLKRCLSSIRNQTVDKKKYHIILIDDVSGISYEDVLNENTDLPIERIVNQQNIGAVPNMVYCIHYPVKTPYKIVFHEDDIMYPDLLEKELAVFSANQDIAWVGTNMSFFTKEVSFHQEKEQSAIALKKDVRKLIETILKGRSLSLASIMYRSEICKKAIWDLETYSMMGDRQMLIELAKEFGAVYLNYNLVSAYDHSEVDFRWKTLKQIHIHNYYKYLHGFFSQDEKNRKDLQAAFTYGYIENFKLLPNDQQHAKFSFYFKAFSEGRFSFKYFLLSFNAIRNIAAFLKRK